MRGIESKSLDDLKLMVGDVVAITIDDLSFECLQNRDRLEMPRRDFTAKSKHQGTQGIIMWIHHTPDPKEPYYGDYMVRILSGPEGEEHWGEIIPLSKTFNSILDYRKMW